MIRIITDSLCDLTMDYAKELNIDIMPLTVRFGEDDFKCGIDLTNEAFYDKLTNDSNNPSTAAAPGYVGYDEGGQLPPLSIHLNSRKFSKNTSMPAMKSWQSSFPNT